MKNPVIELKVGKKTDGEFLTVPNAGENFEKYSYIQ